MEVGGALVDDGEAVDAAAGRGQLEHLYQGGGQPGQRGPEVALHHKLAGHASAGRTITLLVSARAATARMTMKLEKIFSVSNLNGMRMPFPVFRKMQNSNRDTTAIHDLTFWVRINWDRV